MRQKYITYLIVQAAVILAVILCFKFIGDRQLAATVAGVMFVLLPLWMVVSEYRGQKFKNPMLYAGALQFLILFALPILGMRLANWNVPFDQLSFLGVPGPWMHQYSSKSYVLMMLVTAIGLFKIWQRQRRADEKTRGV